MIGSVLTRCLATQGVETFVLSRPGASRLRLEGVKDIAILDGSILDVSSISHAISESRPDVVFHLASTPFNPPSIPVKEHFDVNVLGILNLMEALDQSPNSKLVYTGSAAVYGSSSGALESVAPTPNTILGATKAAASALLGAHARMTGRHVVELRLFSPFGPGERASRILPTIILSALAGNPVDTSEGLQKRDFVFIDDVIDAMLLAADEDGHGPEIYNIGSGRGVSIRDLVTEVLEIMGNPVVANFGAIPTRPDEIMNMTANIDYARDNLGWSPKIGLHEGLGRTIDWVTSNRETVANLT